MLLAQCPVCQELFSNQSQDNVVCALPCGHVFHKNCVDTWFRSASTCPSCRVQVKRMSTIVRLYFDTVPLTFTSRNAKPDAALRHSQSENSSSSQASLKSGNQSQIELYQAQCEITRLEETVKEFQQKVENSARLARDREQEIATLTSLFTESDKMCEKERKRSRELRVELQSMKQFLKEAEENKTEAANLRAEMEDMQNIKKLIFASEESAHELLARYGCKPNQPRGKAKLTDPDLESLCRWTAVLRTELTSSREKARNYRIELSRLRKQQQAACQRAARAENSLNQLQEQMLSGCSTTPVPHVQTPSTTQCAIVIDSPDLFDISPVYGVQKIRMSEAKHTTPQILSTTPANPSTVELQHRLRTPLENPFAVPQDNADSTPAHPLTGAISLDCSLLSTPVENPKSQINSQCQRRPSVLYEMSIMRRRLGGVSAPTLQVSTTAQSSSNKHSSLYLPGRHTKVHKPVNKSNNRHNRMTGSIKLDSFLNKH